MPRLSQDTLLYKTPNFSPSIKNNKVIAIIQCNHLRTQNTQRKPVVLSGDTLDFLYYMHLENNCFHFSS